MSSKRKNREDVVVEIVHKHTPKELEDFQIQRRMRYERSYNMVMEVPTVPEPIEKKMRRVLRDCFGGKKYHPEETPKLAVQAAASIKNYAHPMVSPRVRLVSHVTVGEVKGQEVRCISRCIWDSETDRFMKATVENQQLFVVATLFALYYE